MKAGVCSCAYRTSTTPGEEINTYRQIPAIHPRSERSVLIAKCKRSGYDGLHVDGLPAAWCRAFITLAIACWLRHKRCLQITQASLHSDQLLRFPKQAQDNKRRRASERRIHGEHGRQVYKHADPQIDRTQRTRDRKSYGADFKAAIHCRRASIRNESNKNMAETRR
jgi:hypothetical protein